jgi:hypothetical protein
VIIKVHDRAITTRQVEIQCRIEDCYRDDRKAGTPFWSGLCQLIDAALMEAVARVQGLVITDQMMAEETARVDRETKAPRILTCVKRNCPSQTIYQEIYLRPKLVNRLLYYHFAMDKEIQAEPYHRALEILDQARAGGALSTVKGYSLKEIDLSTKRQEEEAAPELTRYGIELPNPDKEFVEKVLKPLAEGAVYPHLWEARDYYLVVKLLQKQGKLYRYEIVNIQKIEFDPWFLAEIKRIKKEIIQADVIKELLAQVQTGRVAEFLRR